MSEARDLPVPLVQATEYTLSLLPADHVDYHPFAIKVSRLSDDRWASAV